MNLIPAHLSLASWIALWACAGVTVAVAISWLLPRIRAHAENERIRKGDY